MILAIADKILCSVLGPDRPGMTRAQYDWQIPATAEGRFDPNDPASVFGKLSAQK